MHSHSGGGDGARPKHGALARREYGLLPPEEPAGDPAAAEPQERRGGHEANMGTGGPEVTETDTGDINGKRALILCSHPEDSDEKQRPPKG